nr:uncharacterized protein LOC109768684 isoform X2 [Aegilops tauschii subsp. strangulata]XP_040250572.1 uncharacterized protein LOC109768684 isoform X2 [Aegilops tauschii subsp. strangulata]
MRVVVLSLNRTPYFFLEKPKQTCALSGVKAMAHGWGSSHLNLRLWYMSPSLLRVALQDQIETRSHGSSVWLSQGLDCQDKWMMHGSDVDCKAKNGVTIR